MSPHIRSRQCRIVSAQRQNPAAPVDAPVVDRALEATTDAERESLLAAHPEISVDPTLAAISKAALE